MKEHSTSLTIKEMQFKTTQIPCHPSQNSCHQENNSEHWRGCWGQRESHALLVGINAATIEISMEVPQKTKNTITI
jgi:hypothetical protein